VNERERERRKVEIRRMRIVNNISGGKRVN
jgi:hypothetical protein